MDNNRHSELLLSLFGLITNWESEIVEFKEASNDFDKNKIGQYFSAISNEANLKDLQYGWLIFGVRNKDHAIVGTDYRDAKGLEKLKQEIADCTNENISFIDIYEVYPQVDGITKRVVMFQIPAAVTAVPTSWRGHFYGRYGDSLGPLSTEELERIRSQVRKDWSKQFLSRATLAMLDSAAIAMAREKYKQTMNRPHIAEEVDAMTDEQFLTKLKLVNNGRVTNTAMLLLGNEDYDYLFTPVPEAAWRVVGNDNMIRDYEIFKIPFITLNDRLLAKIRNLTYRYMPNRRSLFPDEVKQYDLWLLRELLNNCIAHSLYTSGGRIYLNEYDDNILITNPGTFIPGNVETVLQPSYTPPLYRNQLLAETMVKFNMIDTQTMGMRRVFKILQQRYFPMPDYDFSVRQQIKVRIYGKILDENYTHLLFDMPELDLYDVYYIDRVQKHLDIPAKILEKFRKQGFVIGRKPNVFVSAEIAESLDKKEDYIKHKSFDDKYFKDLILEYLKEYKTAKRQNIRRLLWDKLSDLLSDQQKERKITTLLEALKKANRICRAKTQAKDFCWVLTINKT